MNERWIVAELRLDAALHIGKGKGNKPTDSPIRRAGDGRLVLPGRAIGGALRTTATRLAPRLQLLDDPGSLTCKSLGPPADNDSGSRQPCLCLVCQLFGELYPSESDDGEAGGRASRLWISDSFAEADPQTHVRDGIGMMRDRGTAARNVKFDFETAPRGTTFGVRLRVLEEDDRSPQMKARCGLLAATLAEWEAGRGRLGSSAARGLGAVTLCNVSHLKTALSSPDDLIAYLKARDPWSLAQDDVEFWQSALTEAREAVIVAHDGIPAARGFVSVDFNIETEGPFLSHDPLVALLSGFDHAPQLTIAVGGAGEPLINGGSLRGALRARAEKIARTLWSLRWQSQQEFLAHCPSCMPLARHSREPLSSCDSRIETPTNREVVTDDGDLCLACQLFGSPRQGSRLWVDDGHWAGSALNEEAWKAQDFLAIDRFTGGGQEGAKFDAAPLVNAKFTGRLTLHSPRGWELGWLALVLRDLCDGQITVGFGAAKGYGRVRAKDLIWRLGTLTPHDFAGDPHLLEGASRSGIHLVATRTASELASQLQAWLGDFLALRDAPLMRTESYPSQSDTFFGQPAESLYGLPRSGR